MAHHAHFVDEEEVQVTVGGMRLAGSLALPHEAKGIVLFAHGSGSGRHSPRNRFVASQLQDSGLATLLFDLLSEEEEAIDRDSGHLRFDIGLLAERLVGATNWLSRQSATAKLPVGYFGASTGGGAALVAAADRQERVKAVVSRGGRPDLARDWLPLVNAATLLIVGANDDVVIELNESALRRLGSRTKELKIVPGASHLFEEPGKLKEVAQLAAEWFERHLTGRPVDES